MLRSNRALFILQKTYDDTYLSCSTAVYFENQGNEDEAARHWIIVLQHVHERPIRRALSSKKPPTDAETTLVDAILELELQCKERIDLLEALRILRQEASKSTSGTSTRLTKAPTLHETGGTTPDSIPPGTVPAPSLSSSIRYPLHSRPLPRAQNSHEGASADGRSACIDMSRSTKPSTPMSHSPRQSSRNEKDALSSNPEKHTMRTTLRSGKSGDKPLKSVRRSPIPASEGPSKAATLAWSALGSRERPPKIASSDSSPSSSCSLPHNTMAQTSSRGSQKLQWDSHSRRLVMSRDAESSPAALRLPSPPLQSGEYLYDKSSFLSVSAASSALNSVATQESSTLKSSKHAVRGSPPQRTPTTDQTAKSSKQDRLNGKSTLENATYHSAKKHSRDARVLRNHVAKRSLPLNHGEHDLGLDCRVEKSTSRSTCYESRSSSSGEDVKRTIRTALPGKLKKLLSKDDLDAVSLTGSANESKLCDVTPNDQMAHVMRKLPPGVDEAAAKQILNDIVVQGDEVRWDDVAGLHIAKNALREAVVYPFLRPDLFMGLREPVRGMLLFGPPGTGKTMLARAVATESKSTFFSISASSLTSKYLGDSEKLVKALFSLARMLAPSIIFVDEIDSLLSQRSGSGEHESTRRIKTEFLIQWSDLQRAAAGRDFTEQDKERGDANRVLVLAATNLPWAIDEAARRRFVKRQYIPLPEPRTRETQLRTLLGHQKHELSPADIQKLVDVTEGFSGSDITALAKDAAMGPLRSLGEALLHMTMDEIRPIMLRDFEASLGTIKPSIGKAGLKEYEDWAREFGERGG